MTEVRGHYSARVNDSKVDVSIGILAEVVVSVEIEK